MKNLFLLTILILSGVVFFVSCTEEALEKQSFDPLAEELSTAPISDFSQDYGKYVEGSNWINNADDNAIHWIDNSAADKKKGSTSCCIGCVGNVIPGNVTPSDLYYYIQLYELCEGNITGPPIATWVSGDPNTSTEFPMWDEHEYSLVVQMPGAPADASMTVTIASPNLTYTYEFDPDGPFSTITRLHCNNYMIAKCWPDGVRICCGAVDM